MLQNSARRGHTCCPAAPARDARAGKVDLLVSERKEAQQAVDANQRAKLEQESQRNAYATLMPLALPAPMPGPGYGAADGYGAAGYGAPPPFGAAPGYGGYPGGY